MALVETTIKKEIPLPSLTSNSFGKPIFTSKANNGCKLLDEFAPQEKVGPKMAQKSKPNGNDIQAVVDRFYGIYSKTHAGSTIYDKKFGNGLNCTPDAVREFSPKLFMLKMKYPELDQFDLYAGYFLSVLITKSKKDGFIIEPGNLKMEGFGCRNTKDIIVKGSVAGWLGLHMLKGKITVNGNAGIYCGSGMRGGEIIIHGNVGKDAGSQMHKGTIRIFGKIESIALCKATVYQEGNLLMKDGQKFAEPRNK